MKISLNWIKEFTDLNIGVDELVQKIGSQLGAVEAVHDIGALYDGILIAKVIEVQNHPNADNLTICQLDDGSVSNDLPRNEKNLVQVVCGAPNVAAGQLVAWLPPGTIVPSSQGKDAFILAAKDIRGQTSYGMIGSPRELALSDNHEGILVFDETDVRDGSVTAGMSFGKALMLDDTIIDVENKMFTHRPDCFGMIGLAREISGITGQSFISPDWYQKIMYSLVFPADNRLPIIVDNQTPQYCHRLLSAGLQNVTVKPSPLWLQSYLTRMGVRPVNNVVDITNYVMYLTGQPMHAYDYDKIRGNNKEALLRVRLSGEKEQLILLNGKTVTVAKDSLVIANHERVVGLAGVMGGLDSEVNENTKNIILECASFDMYAIRRSSMANGIFSEASTRFNKGQSPRVADRCFSKAIELLQKLSGGEPAGPPNDDVHFKDNLAEVNVPDGFINKCLGINLNQEQISKLLENVEFKVKLKNLDLDITVPPWRTDIAIKEDIVEEVGRLYGYDHLPLNLPRRALQPALTNERLVFKNRLRQLLKQAGANEVLTYSFVPEKLLICSNQEINDAFKIINALSPELQYYRLSLTPSLLAKVYPNIKAGYKQFALFELNKCHEKNQFEDDEPNIPKEFNRLAVTLASKLVVPNASYFWARAVLDFLAEQLGINLEYKALVSLNDNEINLNLNLAAPFDSDRSAEVLIQGKTIGVVGEYSTLTIDRLKLPSNCAGFEIDCDILLALAPKVSKFQSPAKFPSISQDLTISAPAAINFKEVESALNEGLGSLLPEKSTGKLVAIDIYRAGNNNNKNFTFRLILSSSVRTLTTDEVNELLDKLTATVTALGAKRI